MNHQDPNNREKGGGFMIDERYDVFLDDLKDKYVVMVFMDGERGKGEFVGYSRYGVTLDFDRGGQKHRVLYQWGCIESIMEGEK